jgi:hypothetical protein
MSTKGSFNLGDNSEILKISSPKKSVSGPFAVVYKNIENKWAIVALDWDEVPSLGIRWFWPSIGNPVSRGFPTWFIIPIELRVSILNGLPIDVGFRHKIDQYLCGEIGGDEIMQ